MESMSKRKGRNNGEVKPLHLAENSWRYDFRRNWQLYVLFIPVLAYFIIFHYAPMVGLL